MRSPFIHAWCLVFVDRSFSFIFRASASRSRTTSSDMYTYLRSVFFRFLPHTSPVLFCSPCLRRTELLDRSAAPWDSLGSFKDSARTPRGRRESFETGARLSNLNVKSQGRVCLDIFLTCTRSSVPFVSRIRLVTRDIFPSQQNREKY